eukprot:scaffold22696_cov118-Cylindrotheca_fusiformis.AAC.13
MVEQEQNELPPEFVPSDNDVICGWARQNYHHAGNRMLRDLIQEYVPRYIKATTKTEKGHVIIDIVERIRRDSPSGVGLVRQNKKTGRWFYIGLEKAKDKIGHALRKASLEKTKSIKSNPRKQQYPSSDSLTSLSTSPSPTPVSAVSVPSSPSVQPHPVRYEDPAHGAAYHQHYDEAYQRAYHQHYHHYSAYHQHYAAPPLPGQEPHPDHGGIPHRGYDVYYPYAGAHSYPPAEYPYPTEGGSHPHPHYPPPPSPPPITTHHAPPAEDSHLYSPVSHSPIGHGH